MNPQHSSAENLSSATSACAADADRSEMPGRLHRLQRDLPGFYVWLEDVGDRIAYVARRRFAGLHPHTVVTDNPAELRAALSGADYPKAGGPPAQGDELPQAVADSYPGWNVRHHHGVWMASCPATTVYADSSADLRTAIDREIAGDDGT